MTYRSVLYCHFLIILLVIYYIQLVTCIKNTHAAMAKMKN